MHELFRNTCSSTAHIKHYIVSVLMSAIMQARIDRVHYAPYLYMISYFVKMLDIIVIVMLLTVVL